MAMYLGPDGRIYNRPVRGAVRIDGGYAETPRNRVPDCVYPKPRRGLFSWLDRLFK